jgi:hypothetical protein
MRRALQRVGTAAKASWILSLATRTVLDMSVLGVISPDPCAVLLCTGYSRFTSPLGIDGLAKENGRRLDLLAVVNPTEEHGLFRRFIAEAKLEYDTICVWEIVNPAVEAALGRYGFQPETEISGVGPSVPIEGLRWDKP